jgi:hypothetical protein
MRSPNKIFTVFISLQCSFVMLQSCNNQQLNHPTEKIIVKDSLSSNEVTNPYASHDQSPMDMSYFPEDYPVLKMNGPDTDVLLARVIYSRPQKKGRNIFGNTEKSLRQYGKEWRLGANEATEIEFFKPVKIAGKTIDKGRYIIYCIPFPDKWTIVLNSNLYTWGLHMDTTKDVFKTDIPVQFQDPAIEDFTMVFETAPYGADLLMTWDTVKAVLPISYLK